MGEDIGKELIRRLMRHHRASVQTIVLSSVLLNITVFAGSIYVMLVYDIVLPSRSEATLAALFLILLLIYAFQAVFEVIRAEALLTIANGTHRDLFRPVLDAATGRALRGGEREHNGMQLVRELDQVHGYLAGAGPAGLIDLPWVIIFLVLLTLLHWSLGLTALLGCGVLAGIAWWTNRRANAGTQAVAAAAGDRSLAVQTELRFAEAATALGMRQRLLARSMAADGRYREAQSALSRGVGWLGSGGRVFRLLLQSLILTIGALLVIDDKASGGVIFASSLLSGRVLAPVDQAIANWRNLSAARNGWATIVQALIRERPRPPRTVALAPPSRKLELQDLWIAPPGNPRPIVSGIGFTLTGGQALAIIGPSAAGKTTLAKALAGIWPPLRGSLRLDGATYDQWDADTLGASIGYVPQSVELIEGTIGENIARFDPAATSEAVIRAASAAGMHETILGMPDGYQTRVSTGGPELSAGQRQRIGLARALYGDPFLMVLDEPNSNLDATGDAALAAAIAGVKARNGVVVMITHRPATLGPVTHVALLKAGRLADFGERNAVLQRIGKPAGADRLQPSA